MRHLKNLEKTQSSNSSILQKRVLSLGMGQSNFLLQLYGELKKRDASLLFSIDGFKDITEGVESLQTNIFEQFYTFSKTKISAVSKFFAFFQLICHPAFWKFLRFELSLDSSITGLIKFILAEIKTYAIVKRKIQPLSYDAFHFHFCTENNLKYLHYLPKNSKIICSFWGSDLYRTNNKRNNFYVTEALKKATKVTIQTPEMGDDLYKKHGDFLKQKVVFAQFALGLNIYKRMDVIRTETTVLNTFKNGLGIEEESFVITIGYNANSAFHHIEILEQIARLDKNIKAKITCVLPLTYARKDRYLKKIMTVIEGFDFKIICLHEYMNYEAIAKFRLITDVQIQLPVSDALSGSVTEVLYAGNHVIAASWLPYGIYKRNNIELHYIDAIKDLNHILVPLVNSNVNTEDFDNKKQRIVDVFFPESTSKPWLAMYNQL